MPDYFNYDVFISYGSRDYSRVLSIAEDLRKEGLAVWFDKWMEQPGVDIRRKIVDGLSASRRILFCITESALNSEWAELEVKLTLSNDPNNKQRRLIPLLLEDCAVPSDLALYEAVDGRRFTVETVEQIKRLCLPDYAHAADVPRPSLPGQLPECHNISLRRNSDFCGREELLTQLHEQLTGSHREAVPQIIYGLGGIGKTQLVLEYVHCYGASFRLAWWVRAEFPETARKDYLDLAVRLELGNKRDLDQSSAIRLVRNWLDRTDGWLLIFDNAEAPQSVRDLLPNSSKGSVLITSRSAQLGQRGKKGGPGGI